MPTTNHSHTNTDSVPTAVLQPRKSGFSPIWLLPLIALLIGIFLVYKTLSETGPTITITFASAKGLESGKTLIKYKDVDLGKVTAIDLSEDLSHVVVIAELSKQAERLLSENTRFWVVRARVAATGVSGLSTLFSGAYIAIDPGAPGEFTKAFTGLEDPPAVTTDAPGRRFTLQAATRGSIEKGSPVYYRKLEVGQVTDYNLSDDGALLNLQVFINAPYHRFVYENTRFWNTSGVQFTLDQDGVKIDTGSMISLLIGGVSFGIPQGARPGKPAGKDAEFLLYDNLEKAKEKAYLIKEKWLLYFDESVRGLSPGAPVEMQGIRIGQVLDVHLEYDRDKYEFRIPVLIELEPERIVYERTHTRQRDKALETLVQKGYRAQLDSGNLLTGRQLITVSRIKGVKPATIDWSGPYPIFPTAPKAIQGIKEKVARIIDRIDRLPIREIGSDFKQAVTGVKNVVNSPELKNAIQNLDLSLKESRLLLEELRTEVKPQLAVALDEARKALAGAGELLRSDSPIQIKINQALEEITKASQSMKNLLDYLERHPEALIRGKGDQP